MRCREWRRGVEPGSRTPFSSVGATRRRYATRSFHVLLHRPDISCADAILLRELAGRFTGPKIDANKAPEFLYVVPLGQMRRRRGQFDLIDS